MKPATPSVLIVDDEPDLCWALDLMLRPLSLTVVTSASSGEALARIAENFYAVAFVDVVLPDGNGVTLMGQIRQLSPATTVVLMSGFHDRDDDTITQVLREDMAVQFIPKPFHISDVRQIARQALGLTNEIPHGISARC